MSTLDIENSLNTKKNEFIVNIDRQEEGKYIGREGEEEEQKHEFKQRTDDECDAAT